LSPVLGGLVLVLLVLVTTGASPAAAAPANDSTTSDCFAHSLPSPYGDAVGVQWAAIPEAAPLPVATALPSHRPETARQVVSLAPAPRTPPPRSGL